MDNNDYHLLIASPAFPEGAAFDQDAAHYIRTSPNIPRIISSNGRNISTVQSPAISTPQSSSYVGLLNHVQALQHSSRELERLEKLECMREYDNSILSGRRDVILITEDKALYNVSNAERQAKNNVRHGSLLFSDFINATSDIVNHDKMTGSTWMCSSIYGASLMDCDSSKINTNNWIVAGFKISYCLGERIQGRCKLLQNQVIAVTIVLSNAVKLCCMLYTALKLKEVTLCTQGCVRIYLHPRLLMPVK